MFYKSVYQFLIFLFIFLASASASAAAAASCQRWRGGPLAKVNEAPCPAAPSTSRKERQRPAVKRWRGGPLAEASEAPCPVAPSTSRKERQRPASRTPPNIWRRRYSNQYFNKIFAGHASYVSRYRVKIQFSRQLIK